VVSSIPDLRPAERPPINSDEAGLWMMADRAEQRLKSSGEVVRDPALNEYVRGIVCKLAAEYCSDIRVYVVRHAGFNAMMAANGMMIVWTGLLARVRNEAQLAAVLGHEIAHYLRRHSVQIFRDARDKAAFGTFMAVAFGAAGGLVQLAMLGSLYSFSRDQEREADDIGIRLLARAGYDPRETPKVWENLIAEHEKDEDYKKRSIFFATHPQGEERRDTLRTIALELGGKAADAKIGRDELLAVVGPHRATYLRDELNQRKFGPFDAVLGMLLTEDFNLGEVHYFRGEMFRLRGKDGDAKSALEAYVAAEKAGGAPLELHRSLGLVYNQLGEPDRARAAFAKYLELKPDAEDREMIRSLLPPTS
jgi:hypothetical protein